MAALESYRVGDLVQVQVGANWVDGIVVAVDWASQLVRVKTANGMVDVGNANHIREKVAGMAATLPQPGGGAARPVHIISGLQDGNLLVRYEMRGAAKRVVSIDEVVI